MRRITLWAASTLTIVVLLFSYRTSTSAGTSTSLVGVGVGVGPGTVAAAGGDPTSQGSGPSGGSGSSAGSGSQTVTGDAVSTRYGDVQVRITVNAGKVTAATVTQVPWQGRTDQEINGRAVPILDSEAVAAQSASIDMVSGATYTSEGYTQSLQSAIDKANL